MAGTIAAAIGNSNRTSESDHAFGWLDFFPEPGTETEEQDEAQMFALMERLARRHPNPRPN